MKDKSEIHFSRSGITKAGLRYLCADINKQTKAGLVVECENGFIHIRSENGYKTLYTGKKSECEQYLKTFLIGFNFAKTGVL